MLLAGVAYLIAVSAAVIAAFYFKSRAERWGLIDMPGGRKSHEQATPLIGGLIIWVALWSLVLAKPDLPELMSMLLLSALTVVIGVWDDRRELSAGMRLVTHLALGAAMALWAGVRLDHLGALLAGSPLVLGLLAVPVTCFAVAASMNAINMIDGVDGLAGALSLLPVLVVASLAAHAGDFALLMPAVALAGGLTVFLLLNFPFPWRDRASCFLGDTGSTLLGLMVAWLLIEGSSQGLFRPVLALFLLAMPLLDTAGVIVRRVLRGVSVSTAGRDHFHHVFIDAGMRHRHVVYMMVAVALLIATVGLVLERRGTPEWVMFAIFSSLLAANLIVLRSAERAKVLLRDRWFSGNA